MCDGTFSHHCSKKSISTTCGIPQYGTYSKKYKSTTSFYVVLVPHGIGEMVLIALTSIGTPGIAAARLVCLRFLARAESNEKYWHDNLPLFRAENETKSLATLA